MVVVAQPTKMKAPPWWASEKKKQPSETRQKMHRPAASAATNKHPNGRDLQ